jgi:thioredoxin 1
MAFMHNRRAFGSSVKRECRREVKRLIELNKDNFEEEVLKSDLPVLVDLWGPKCGPCLALMPQVEELSHEFEGKVKFCKLNVAENRKLVISLRVMGVPTFLFYKGGEIVDRLSGAEAVPDAIKAKVRDLA